MGVNMHHHHKHFYGTTTVGKRGQVVIPAKAREEFDLKEGDKLLVLGRFGRFIGLVKADDFNSFIERITSKMEKGIERLKKYGKNHNR